MYSMRTKALNHKIEIDESFIEEAREKIKRQLNEYLSGERQEFDLQIDFPSSFVGKVMEAISEIPYGETKTYGEIANQVDSSAIAVGQACGKNPVPLVVPCHRVVGRNSIGGYAHGTELKRSLLDLETES